MSSVEERSPRFPPLLVLCFGLLAISFSAIFIRWAQDEDVPSLVIAAWRTLMASLILWPFALARRREELGQLGRREWRLAFLSGVMLAIHFGSWISSLAFTSVASSTVLVTTSPLWVGLLAPVFLGERLSRPLKVGIGLAVVGSVIISVGDLVVMENGRFFFDFSMFSGGSQTLLGNGLALIGALTAAVYFMVGRSLRPQLSLLSYTAVVYGTAALCLVITTFLAGYNLFGYTPRAYLLFLLMALFPQLMGHTSYNWALGYLPAAYVSITILAEPIGASLLALLFFREIPGIPVLAGSLFIFWGVVRASQPERILETEPIG
ncbi:MAG: DMT family transporter [Chloroflexi bacterium]|nr:MAG: DMT family transporter [Chloroflexota bacterium]